MTKAEVQWLLEHIIGADENNSLVNRFSHGDDVRGQIRKVAKQAVTYLMDTDNYNDPADPEHLAKTFQDSLFSFNKNAAANPLANVLGAQDDWGELRQLELKAIIRDVLHEAPDQAEKDQSAMAVLRLALLADAPEA